MVGVIEKDAVTVFRLFSMKHGSEFCHKEKICGKKTKKE